MITLETRRAFLAARRQASITRESRIADVACFLIPAFQPLTIHFIGVIPGGDLFALAILPFAIATRAGRLWNKRMKMLLGLAGFWLLAQTVSDVIRHSDVADMAKGAAAISFFISDLACLAILIHREQRRVVMFGIGAIIGAALYIYLAPGHSPIPDATFAVNWKFGYTSVFTPIVMLISCYFFSKRQYWLVLAAAIAIAGVNLMFNARSAAIVVFVSVVQILPFFKSKLGTSVNFESADRRVRVRRVVVLLGLTVFAALIGNQIYGFTASHGILGEDAQLKYEAQSRGEYGVLIGGRPEVLFEGQAVRDSPIIGHGSYAKDPKYAALLRDLLIETGYEEEASTEPESDDADQIPVHSFLMQAWIWAGIFGAVFWLYALRLTASAVFELSSTNSYLAPYYAVQIINFFWEILFSPFGQGERMNAAFVLVIVCMILPSLDKRMTPISRARDAFRPGLGALRRGGEDPTELHGYY